MERILIIDDDTALCELVGEYLQPLGFAVEAVHRGDTGAERALRSEHDLILLDVMLPGQNGFEVLRQIRESSKIPVLMLPLEETTSIGLSVSRSAPTIICRSHLIRANSLRAFAQYCGAAAAVTMPKAPPPLSLAMWKWS